MSEKIDSGKDLLFSKLLPALSNNPFSSTYEGEVPQTVQPKEDTNDELTALCSRLFARPSTYKPDSYATVNVMESVILKNLDQVMRRFNTCSCDRCRCDVASHALNHLPPKYIVADPAKMADAEESIPSKLVMDALVNAAICVRSKPRH